MEQRMTQHQRIQRYLNEFGSITPIEAFRDLGITKLATRISEMRRMGYHFGQRTLKCKNRYGESVTYACYFKEDNNERIQGQG